ncbi:Rieske (2Fe-2S) protein [Halobacteriaceae archaeon GCM10025711]
MDEAQPVSPVEDVPTDTTLLVTASHDDEDREVVLHRSDGEVRAWRNQCQHWTDVPLDKGDGATMRGDELVCTRHGATFETDDGYCTFGPCEGAYLPTVDVAVRDGDVYLVDDEYTFVRLGGVEDDGESTPRVGFD